MSKPTEASRPDARATFALTLDTELVWGSFDVVSPDRFAREYPDIRGTIQTILRILEQHDVSATWAVLGHLFLDACERDESGVAHPELAATRQSNWSGDWYSMDPCTDQARDPLWYGTDIIDAILASTPAHEIAAHSFGHPVYGDPEFTREAADADLEASVRLARDRGVTLRSFVFPRNVEGHLDLLRKHGFIAFRGVHPTRGTTLPRPARRAAHLARHIAGFAPPVSRPAERLPGLWDIKGSMLIMSRSGMRRLIPRSSRTRQARAGLDAAVSTGGVFHLWTHPFNLANDPPYLTGWLEDTIREAARLRDRGLLEIDTMAGIAEQAALASAR